MSFEHSSGAVLYKNTENGRIYLRVYEFAGADGTVTLQGYRLHICDLLEQETGECFDETVSVTGRQIRTFRVEKK